MPRVRRLPSTLGPTTSAPPRARALRPLLEETARRLLLGDTARRTLLDEGAGREGLSRPVR